LPAARTTPIRGSVGVRITENGDWPDMGRHPEVWLDTGGKCSTVADGRWIFDMVPFGFHTVHARYKTYADKQQSVYVFPGNQVIVNFDFGGQ
jgi:hypothetical protein